HGADATSPTCTDSVLLRASALFGAHHTLGATEEIVSPTCGGQRHPVAFLLLNERNQDVTPTTSPPWRYTHLTVWAESLHVAIQELRTDCSGGCNSRGCFRC